MSVTADRVRTTTGAAEGTDPMTAQPGRTKELVLLIGAILIGMIGHFYVDLGTQELALEVAQHESAPGLLARPAEPAMPARAEVERADVMQVLLPDRLVEQDLAPEARDRRLEVRAARRIHARGATRLDLRRIAGRELQDRERDERDPDQGRDHPQEAPEDVREHGVRALYFFSLVGRVPGVPAG